MLHSVIGMVIELVMGSTSCAKLVIGIVIWLLRSRVMVQCIGMVIDLYCEHAWCFTGYWYCYFVIVSTCSASLVVGMVIDSLL